MVEFFESIQATLWCYLASCIVFIILSIQMTRHIWQTNDKNIRIALLGIIALGLGLRLAWIGFAQPVPVSDFAEYWRLANQFHAGDMTFDIIIRHPGPAVLFYFIIQLFGATLASAWFLNQVFSIILMLSMFALTKDMLGKLPALGVVVITATLPQLITYTAITGSEIMCLAFILLTIWGFFQLWQKEHTSPWQWMALGILLYGATLIRSSNLMILGLIPLMVLLFKHSQWKHYAIRYSVMVATTVVMLFGWMFHQYLVTDGYAFKMFYGAELGFACAVQYNEDGTYNRGAYMPPEEWSFFDKVQPYFSQDTMMGDIKGYEVAGQEAMKVIMANPVEYVTNGFYRMKRALNTSQTGIRWSEAGSANLQALPTKIVGKMANVSTIYWQVLLYLSPIGILLYRREYDKGYQHVLTFVGMYAFFWIFVHILLAISSERYGLQLAPFIIMLFMSVITVIVENIHNVLFQPNPKRQEVGS